MYVISGFAELRGASKLSGLAETVKVQPKLLVTTPLPSHAGTQGTQIRQARNYRKENSSHFEQLPLSTILGAHLGQIREEKNYPPFKVLFKYTGRHHYRQNSNFNSEISWLLSAEATFLIPGLVEKREERMYVCEKKPSALSEKHQHRGGAARMTGLCTKARARKMGSWGNQRAHCGISMGMRGTYQTLPCTTGGAKVPSSGALCRGGESLNPEQDHQTHLPHHRPRWVLRPPTNPACCGQPAKADKS